MRFLKAVIGGVLGAVPGIVLMPVLELFALVVIFTGVVAGGLMAWAPRGQRVGTAKGVLLGFVAAGILAGVPYIGAFLAPVAIIYGGWYGMNRMNGGTRPVAQP